MSEHTLIREDASKTLWEKVNQWFDNSPAKSMFSDARGICKTAVAEYLANQMGHTIYTSMAVRDEYWYQQDEAKKILEDEARADRERIEHSMREAQRSKEEALYQSASNKLTSAELKALQKRFRK